MCHNFSLCPSLHCAHHLGSLEFSFSYCCSTFLHLHANTFYIFSLVVDVLLLPISAVTNYCSTPNVVQWTSDLLSLPPILGYFGLNTPCFHFRHYSIGTAIPSANGTNKHESRLTNVVNHPLCFPTYPPQ